jgi:ribosome biogenesis protein MAK21
VDEKLYSLSFVLFQSFVKKGEVDSKMMSALLSGVNRAYPFAKGKNDMISIEYSY